MSGVGQREVSGVGQREVSDVGQREVSVVGQRKVSGSHDPRLPLQFCVRYSARSDLKKNILQLFNRPR